MPLPKARRIRDNAEKKAVINAAIADKDNMTVPTHVVEKNGKIVGGWSLGKIPLVLVWHKSDEINAKESLILNNTFRSIMNDRGEGPFIIACNGHSPYIRHMKRFGFNPVWETNLFVSE